MQRLQKWKLPIIGFCISVLILAPVIFITPLIIYQTQQVVLTPDPTFNYTVNAQTLEQTRQILDDRLQDLDQPPTLHSVFLGSRVAVRGENIIVSIPRTAQQTKLIEELTASSKINLIETGIEFPAVDGVTSVKASENASPEDGVYQILLQSQDFVQAQSLPDKDGFSLEIVISSAGEARLKKFLEDHRGAYLCLTHNDIVIGCPIVKLTADNHLQIWQGPTKIIIDDNALMQHINTGALPIPMVAAITQ